MEQGMRTVSAPGGARLNGEGMGLTAKQEAFSVAVAKGDTASIAYRATYDASNMSAASVHVAACRLLKNAKVTLRVQELQRTALAASHLEMERVLRECAWVTYNDPGRLFDDAGNLIPVHKLPIDVRATIASIEFDAGTGAVKKIRFWDKNSAIEKAMKYLGAFKRDNRQQGRNLALQVNLIGAPAPLDVQAKRGP
jgi:phage terminase small subunit